MEILGGMVADVFGATGYYFTNGDWIGLGLLALVALLGALTTSSLGNAFATAVWTMPVYGIVAYVRDALSLGSSTLSGGSPWMEALDDGWITVTRMNGIDLIGLYVALVVLILIFYLLRNALNRG
ncbi:MAG: hypothetical protein AAFV51_13400 [Pseudomonadota bacterium]